MTAAPELPAPVVAAVPPSGTGAAALGPAGLAREWQSPFPLDARLSLSVHRRGGGDPAYAVDAAGAVWRTSLTPDGPATLRVRSRPARSPEAGAPGGTLVTAQAWGPGAAWLLDRLPAHLGGQDERSGFTARDPVVRELMRR